jgi:phage terminase large subunit-like protein
MQTRAERVAQYGQIAKDLSEVNDQDQKNLTWRTLCCKDLFFLLTIACGRSDLDRDWLFHRCEEVRRNPDGYLDLWAREHYKSTIITFGKTIQDLLVNPELTVGILSYNRSTAKRFLRQIKQEFESNTKLKRWFPDILWENPQRESPKWSEETGIILKRKTNPKESSIEAHGLVDGQPTSAHFGLIVYDDTVTRESVYTPEQIQRTNEAWELSLNIGTRGGSVRYIGTRYHFNDTYKLIMDRGAAIPRIYPATEDGTFEGVPVLLSREELEKKRREMGEYTFGAQMLQNPIADSAQGFRMEWFQTVQSVKPPYGNKYILVDAANAKREHNDYTSMWVVECRDDGNYYVVDGVRDRLNLTERTRAVFNLHRKHRPRIVGYEKYGLMSDTDHMRYVMGVESYHFPIVELGGNIPKNDRIRKLIPIFQAGRLLFLHDIPYTDTQGRRHNLTQEFLQDEYLGFPVSTHDDMLDCLARIVMPEVGAAFPQGEAYGQRVYTETVDDSKSIYLE